MAQAACNVYMEEMGCDRRLLDAQSIRNFLESNGYVLVNDPKRANKIIVVTCAFKKAEEDESVKRLRSLRRYGREILVYGCLADIAAERYAEFSDLPSVSPRNINSIDQHFEEAAHPFSETHHANVIEPRILGFVRVRRLVESRLILSPDVVVQIPRFGLSQLRALRSKSVSSFNLFINRGCLGSCSYCAIRKAVGRVQSKTVDDIVAEFRSGYAQGYRAFSLLGDDTGCYGADISASLPELLGALFDACPPHPSTLAGSSASTDTVRFDIREIHARYLVAQHEEILSLPRASLIEGILCPSQSGSDRILGLMRREHTADELLQSLKRIRSRYPRIRLDTQIIIGFPTETRDDFVQTLHFVRDAGCDSVVVFPYDDKPGTRSAQMSGKIDQSEIQSRVKSAFRFFRRAGIRAYRSCP